MNKAPQLIMSVPPFWEPWERIPYHLVEDPSERIWVGQHGWGFYPPELASAPQSFRDEIFRSCRRLLEIVGERHDFAAEIGRRGRKGSHQVLCLCNVRLFGRRPVLADHVWVDKGRVWDSAEPLIQGRLVMVNATVTAYPRPEAREFSHGRVRVRVDRDAGLRVHWVRALGAPKLANSPVANQQSQAFEVSP